MKKKAIEKKLELMKETVRALGETNLSKAAGGEGGGGETNPSSSEICRPTGTA